MRPGIAVKMAAAALFCGTMLAGCGEEFPVLTQEEYDLIVDYSAGVLSKYNMLNGDKLTRLAPEPEEAAADAGGSAAPAAPAANAQETAAQQSSTQQISEEEPAAPDDGQEADTGEEASPAAEAGDGEATDAVPAGEGTAEETGGETAAAEAATDAGAEGTAEVSDAQPAAAGEKAVDIGGNDLLQKMQSGIAVDFNGYYVLNAYPDHASGGTVLTAEPGNKLLILSFSLRNETGSAINVDLLSSDPMFTLLLNGQAVSKNLVTLLDNDMSTYVGTIAAGDAAGAVLCFQVKEAQAKAIDTLNLKMNWRGEEQILKIE